MNDQLRKVIVYVGVKLFMQKRKHGNDALKGLSVSEFHAHALADLGNFFAHASTRITPNWSEEQVIAAMGDAGWFDSAGIGTMTMKDLVPLLPKP